jgi:hypothetical protein
MPGSLNEPLGFLGAALVEFDAIKVPAGSAGRLGKRAEPLSGGKQERSLTA